LLILLWSYLLIGNGVREWTQRECCSLPFSSRSGYRKGECWLQEGHLILRTLQVNHHH